MHICCKLVNDVAEMTQGQKELTITCHKQEQKPRIRSDVQDRQNVKEKLQTCIDPLEPDDHPQELVNIVTGRIAPSSVNVDRSVEIGKAQLASYEGTWPDGFNSAIPKQVVTMAVTKKSLTVGNKEVYDVNLIYSRVLGLQQSRDIDLKKVLKHELAPVPTSMFKESGEMRTATSKSDLKHKLQRQALVRLTEGVEATIIDGCAVLWSVHWPNKGTVQDYINNFCDYVMSKTAHSDVYLTFDRYYDFSIKSITRGARAGKHATRRHQLGLQSPLPPQKVVLTVIDNKVQLLDLLCEQLIEKVRKEGKPAKHKLIVTSRDPSPIELYSGHSRQRDDLKTSHEEADVIMVYHLSKLAEAGCKTIKVISDDTDVFVLLLHICSELNLHCNITMEPTSSSRTSVDVPASAEQNLDITRCLLAAHALSGCDTVAQMYGVGKGTVVTKLKAGQPLELLGNLQVPIDDVVIEATKFTATCYGVNVKEGEDMSDVRVEVWSRKIGKNITSAPELKSIPPTSEAFRENVKRAHIQAAIWKSCLQPDPPPFDATQYGWIHDEASKKLIPLTLPSDVQLSPPEILGLLRCGCTAPLTNLVTQHVVLAYKWALTQIIYHVHSFMHVKEKSDVVTSLSNVKTYTMMIILDLSMNKT